jgi:hypothetical protein
MKAITVDMFLNEPKKNSVRYDAAQQTGKPALSAVYIANEAIDGEPPAKIRVTITERD